MHTNLGHISHCNLSLSDLRSIHKGQGYPPTRGKRERTKERWKDGEREGGTAEKEAEKEMAEMDLSLMA